VNRQRDIIERPEDAQDTDRMDVVLVRVSDGERRVCLPSWKDHYTWADEYWWTEGNQGCDGNRHDEWHLVNDLDVPEDHDCGHSPKRYYVILRAP
jgi:hypothetical protein